MTLRQIFFTVALLFGTLATFADNYPTISPTFTAKKTDGTEESGTSISGSAPITAQFFANASNAEGWTAYYEWRFTLQHLNGQEDDTPYLIRYEEDTEVTFKAAGLHKIVCYATFSRGDEKISYTEEYWADEGVPLTVSISESRLEMPNAFSPNDDGINDYYQAKGTYEGGNGPQSIVEFEGIILNRWGKRLYTWTDCYNHKAGWDGKYNGHPVKEGVYFCVVRAKGADGRDFNIRTAVNLLRGYTEGNDSTPME
ncbi:MAG: gliding motility-associated C-terminal domain-containing protein [Prevotella sp.]|nr:gliding motility-associated C-terminal domain-containing protein [Prevotella sp.]